MKRTRNGVLQEKQNVYKRQKQKTLSVDVASSLKGLKAFGSHALESNTFELQDEEGVRLRPRLVPKVFATNKSTRNLKTHPSHQRIFTFYNNHSHKLSIISLD